MKLDNTPQSYLETVKEVEEAIESLKQRGLIVEVDGGYQLTCNITEINSRKNGIIEQRNYY